MDFPVVSRVKYLGDYRLSVAFSDGLVAELDWTDRIRRAAPGGVYDSLKASLLFSQVELWPDARTIRWPNGADICPDSLYAWAKECALKREG